MGSKRFKLVARVSSSSPKAVKPILEGAFTKGSVKEANGEFAVEAEMEGKGAKESAQALNVSTATVRNHIRALLRKLRVHSKLEAIALVLRAAPGDRARRVAAEGPSR